MTTRKTNIAAPTFDALFWNLGYDAYFQKKHWKYNTKVGHCQSDRDAWLDGWMAGEKDHSATYSPPAR